MCKTHSRHAKVETLSSVLVTQGDKVYRLRRLKTTRPYRRGDSDYVRYCWDVREQVEKPVMFKHGARYGDPFFLPTVYVCGGVVTVSWSGGSKPCVRGCGKPIGTKHGHKILSAYPAGANRAAWS